MKTMMRILSIPALLGVSLLGMIPPASAAPLQRAHVIQDPVWVLHLDADALRPTVVGQYLLAEMAKPEAQKKLAAFQAIFNFDPSTSLHGATLYGATKAEEDSVLLVYADFDAARLTTLAGGAKDATSSRHGTHEIHSWLDEKKPEKNGLKPRTYAAIHGNCVIFAQQEARVATALDVLDRVQPNLSANPQFARLEQAGNFIQGAAREPALPPSDPNSMMLKQSKMATLLVGETQGTMRASLTLDTASAEVAAQLEAVGRGLVGLMTLQQDKPESQKLAQGLTVQQDEASVTVRLALPVGDAVAMIKADAARKAAKKD